MQKLNEINAREWNWNKKENSRSTKIKTDKNQNKKEPTLKQI